MIGECEHILNIKINDFSSKLIASFHYLLKHCRKDDEFIIRHTNYMNNLYDFG